MSIKVSAKLPDQTVNALDVVARQRHRRREDVIRVAIETYLEDFDDLAVSKERLRDEDDLIHDWNDVKRTLLKSDDR